MQDTDDTENRLQMLTTTALFNKYGSIDGVVAPMNGRDEVVHKICTPLRNLRQEPTAKSLGRSWGWTMVIRSRLEHHSGQRHSTMIDTLFSNKYALHERRDTYIDVVVYVVFWLLEQDRLKELFEQLRTLRTLSLSKYTTGDIAAWDKRPETEMRIFRHWSHMVISTAIVEAIHDQDIPHNAPWSWREPLYMHAFFQWFTNSTRLLSMLSTADHAVSQILAKDTA